MIRSPGSSAQSQEMELKADEVYYKGDPAEAMFVVLDGQFRSEANLAASRHCLPKPGDVTGVLPFSRMKQFP